MATEHDLTQKSSDRISVTVVAGNVEADIRECLVTVKWADEIIVVSSGVDRTAAIAREYTDKVLVKEWAGYGAQKQFALGAATSEWVLSVDTDERVSIDLRREIQSILTNGTTYAGFCIPRRGYFLGRWIKHCGWYPDYQLRFFRRSKARTDSRKVHERFIVDGSVGHLKSDLIHYTHPTIEKAIAKAREYAALEAMEKAGKKRVSALFVVLHPIYEFFNCFLLKQGFRDGTYGLMVSLIHAISDAQVYMKIWELQHVRRSS
ncbi:MAG: glycosyltransferase family 2 protein [Bacteroidota bacterium]